MMTNMMQKFQNAETITSNHVFMIPGSCWCFWTRWCPWRHWICCEYHIFKSLSWKRCFTFNCFDSLITTIGCVSQGLTGFPGAAGRMGTPGPAVSLGLLIILVEGEKSCMLTDP